MIVLSGGLVRVVGINSREGKPRIAVTAVVIPCPLLNRAIISNGELAEVLFPLVKGPGIGIVLPAS